jgi:hypothetical protein
MWRSNPGKFLTSILHFIKLPIFIDRLTHEYDCTSNLIFFDKYILDDDKNSIKLSNDQYLLAVETISAPIMVFELNISYPIRFYYFTNGSKSLLLGVHFINGMWKAKEYIENTSVSIFLTRLNQHLQDGKITVYIKNEFEENALENLFI